MKKINDINFIFDDKDYPLINLLKITTDKEFAENINNFSENIISIHLTQIENKIDLSLFQNKKFLHLKDLTLISDKFKEDKEDIYSLSSSEFPVLEILSLGDNNFGNKIIDVVIHQKSEICRNKGINFTFSPNNIKFEFADETDICCILSNLLDNAVESAEKSSGKLLNVEFFSHADRNMLFIEIENSCDNEPNMKNGHLLTAKKDKSKHGIGLYSVEKTVKKYNGELYFNYSEDTKKFRISVMLHK